MLNVYQAAVINAMMPGKFKFLSDTDMKNNLTKKNQLIKHRERERLASLQASQ